MSSFPISRRRRIACTALACAAIGALLVPAAVHAQDSETNKQLSVGDPEGWRFEVQPYLWMSALAAEADAGAVEGEVDAEFSDLLDFLDKALMLHAEAHYGSWGMFTDVMWTRLSKDRAIGPAGSMDITLDTWFIELGGFYRFTKEVKDRTLTIDPLFGVRVGIAGTELDLTTGAGTATVDSNETWVDPMIGVRTAMQFTPKISAGLRADLSGFGVGSELTWNIHPEMRYRINDLFTMTFGYRYMAAKFETDSDTDIDVSFNGPVLGFLFTF